MRKQKEQIEAAYDELRHQEQLRTEFLTTLAHELRTPLTSASGFMQLLKVGAMNGPALTMSLQKISMNIDRIVSLVNDLLFVQEQDLIEPALRPVSLPALLEVIVSELREDAQDQGSEIKIEVPPDLPTIQADPDGLVRAFNKLLDNAVKFSPDGGDIVITAHARPRWIDVDFTDKGVGIRDAFKPRLFQRFEHTDRIGDRVFGGVGLGLAIAKHIIESHGGSISVQSTEGAGSTFTVHLPIDGGQPQLGVVADTLASQSDEAWVDAVPSDSSEPPTA
jgi:two-component system phosphate regulon sensor histidine kinase PhoR